MSNKVNHRRARGHIRGRDSHPCGRKACGMCGPKSKVKKNEAVERIALRELHPSNRAAPLASRAGDGEADRG